MALSGSFGSDVGSRWRVQGDWSAVQSISGNYSDVTLKIYWMSLDQYGATSTTATKNGSVTINGSTESFTFSAKISAKEKKLIKTYKVRVNHSSDGTKTFSMSASVGIELNLNGTQYNSIPISANNVVLNTIARASSISVNTSWTAGSNASSVTITRQSSSFTHRIVWQVKNTSGSWVDVRTVTNATTSASGSFSVDDNTRIFNTLAQRSSAETRIKCTTYSGSTVIGSDIYSSVGTVKIPTLSDVSKLDGKANGGDRSNDGYHQYTYIDDTLNIGIVRYNSAFQHTLAITCGTFTATVGNKNIGTTTSFTPTSAQQTSLYTVLNTVKSKEGNIRVHTYYNGVQVGTYTDSKLYFYVKESISKPTFATGNFTYLDSFTGTDSTVAMTGSNQYIVQNKSNLRVTIGTAGTARNQATIRKYEVTVNGVTKSLTAIGTLDFGKVNVKSNTKITVKVTDSRGFFVTASKTMSVIPYTNPTARVRAIRSNSFETPTTLTVSGTFPLVKVGTTVKNSISSVKFRYKQADSTSWNSLTDFAFTQNTTNGTFSVTSRTVNLDNMKAWNVEVVVRDKLGNTTFPIKVSRGRPIFYMDADMNSISFNDLPTEPNQFLVNGQIVFGSTMWSSQGQGEFAGAMFMNNSDITGVNGIYFNDYSESSGEGLLFLKSGKPANSRVNADYDTFKITDGTSYINNQPMGSDNASNSIVKPGSEGGIGGGIFLHDNQTVNLSKPINQTPHGIVLVWSRYISGTGVDNSQFQFTFIPKRFVTYTSSGSRVMLPYNNTEWCTKYFYINSQTTIGGHANNSASPSNNMCLRDVWEV